MTTTKPKSLAEFKRRVRTMTLVSNQQPRRNPDGEWVVQEAPHKFKGIERTATVRSQDIILTTPDGVQSFLGLGKAEEWVFVDENTVRNHWERDTDFERYGNATRDNCYLEFKVTWKDETR